MNRLRRFFPHVLALALLLFFSLFLWGPGFAQRKEKAVPTVKWEYKVIGPQGYGEKMQEALNELGQDGWECVGTVSEVWNSGGDRIRTKAHLVCKRPKQ